MWSGLGGPWRRLGERLQNRREVRTGQALPRPYFFTLSLSLLSPYVFFPSVSFRLSSIQAATGGDWLPRYDRSGTGLGHVYKIRRRCFFNYTVILQTTPLGPHNLQTTPVFEKIYKLPPHNNENYAYYPHKIRISQTTPTQNSSTKCKLSPHSI